MSRCREGYRKCRFSHARRCNPAAFSVPASYLLHPVDLADLFQFKIQGHPGAHHLGIHLAKPAAPYTPTRPVTHEFRTFSFCGPVRDWRPVMDASTALLTGFFPRNDDPQWHGGYCILIM